MDLTEKEIEILKGSRTNCFADAYIIEDMECGEPYVFSIIEETSMNEKTARGVLSSLVKKELVEVHEIEGDHNTLILTETGKKIFDDNIIECKTPWQK